MTDPANPVRVLLGQITGAHGIKGDVMVRSFAADPADIAAYGPLSNALGTQTFKLRIVRTTDKGVIARVAGVTDRNGAEALRGQELYVERSRLPKPQAAEFYHADLIGLAAVSPDGGHLGRVVAVQNFGAGDLLEIEMAGSVEIEFIPFMMANVPEVDLEQRRVVIIPPVMVGDPEPATEQPQD